MSDINKIYKIVETIESNEKAMYNLNVFTDSDLHFNFGNYASELAKAYATGVTIEIHYNNKVLTYHSPQSYKWQMIQTNTLPEAMLKFATSDSQNKTIAQLISIKEYLESYQPRNWYNNVRKINGLIFTLVNKYNHKTIKKLEQGKWDAIFSFTSKLCYDMSKLNSRTFSTYNPKDFFEVKALITVERAQEDLEQQANRLCPNELTEEQLDELYRDALRYGVVSDLSELGQKHYSEFSRYTKAGFTCEPSYSMVPTQGYFNKEQMSRDYQNATVSTKSSPVRSKELEKIQYSLLQEYKKHGEDFLNTGYHVCPKCHKVYHEQDGCPCGHCAPIELTDKGLDNLSYEFDINEIDIDRLIDTIKANKTLTKTLLKHTTFEQLIETLRKINKSKKVSEFVELAENAGPSVLQGLKFL